MAKQFGGLGKGLGALIPVSAVTGPSVIEIEVDDIEPNPHQPRQVFDPAAIAELADSLRQHGVLQPLLVARADDPQEGQPHYQLIAGERRWQAARKAGLRRVPAVVKDATPQQMLELALVENIQRADLNPLEEAEAYRHLVDEFHISQEEVAAKVNKSPAAVSNSLRLLALPDAVKAALAAQKISESHARALLSLDSRETQITVLGEIVTKGLSVRQTEELTRRLARSQRPASATRGRSEQVDSLEEDFRRALGTKVELFRSRKGGRLIVYFYDDDQLQGIYDHIMSAR